MIRRARSSLLDGLTSNLFGRARPLASASLVACASLTACSANGGPSSSSASASGSSPVAAATPSPERAARLAALVEAEQRRAPSLVEDGDSASPDPEIRRAAARALARIAGSRVRERLLKALTDEDATVVAWAAYGLGFDCGGETKDETVDAIVSRAVSLPEEARYEQTFAAMARAIGSCAGTRSEDTLVAWLAPGKESTRQSRARAAALGLGDLASRNKRLREDTWVTLFARAAGGVSDAPMMEAFFPVTRVENLPPSVVERLVEVAGKRLGEQSEGRMLAIKALGRGRETALPLLEKVLVTEAGSFTMPERVEATRAAARLGDDGQVLLGKAIERATAQPAELAKPGAEAAVALAALAGVKNAKLTDKALLAVLTLAPAASDARARRVTSMLRCAAARVPSVAKPTDTVLLECDVDHGSIGKRALLDVLDRVEVRGALAATFANLAKDPDVLVRERALELLGAHAELEALPILVAALTAKEPGVVSTAADQIAAHPRLASPRPKPKPKPKADKKKKDGDKEKDEKKDDKKDDKKPEAEVEEPAGPPAKEIVDALLAALARGASDNDPELANAAMDALGALGDRALSSKLEPFCSSGYPTLREHAAAALALLSGTKKPTCEAPDKADVVAPETNGVALSGTVKLVFDTDAGSLEMELDPAVAPVAVARVVALAKRGYYDGNVIHRVDPSFVVQFGAPFGDGYAGPTDVPPVRCETSPLSFAPLSVGVALSGRDTGSSQLFVMRERHPHLDGRYPLVGTAKGPWAEIFEGDTIRKVTVEAR
ncbi:MAG: HEAT repeat domain-containing protein [Polyangiaceae bacterium]